MEGNKDDALKCLKIGTDAMKSADRARALKFLVKARRLDPNLQVDDLISTLERETEEFTADNASGSAKEQSREANDQPSLRRRTPASSPGNSSSSSHSSSTTGYTEEQIAIVRDIKQKKDYYEILGLERSCSVEDVRKAYRKLSLKVHPDKNKAPGAEEAFKAVSKAFQCLSNDEGRRKYDISGSEEPVYQTRRRTAPAHGFNGFNGYYEDEFDADEIFRSFFFGGMPPATAQFRSFNFGPGVRVPRTDNSGFNFRMLLQLLPVLFILLLNFLPSPQPVYSLSRSYPYEYKHTTQKGVNYYVKSDKFDQEFPLSSPGRQKIEHQVDSEYFSILAQNCRFELQRQQWGFVRETPHCDMLQRFKSTAAA